MYLENRAVALCIDTVIVASRPALCVHIFVKTGVNNSTDKKIVQTIHSVERAKKGNLRERANAETTLSVPGANTRSESGGGIKPPAASSTESIKYKQTSESGAEIIA